MGERMWPGVCLALLVLATQGTGDARGEIYFNDSSVFVLGPCGDLERRMGEEGMQHAVPPSGEGRVHVFTSRDRSVGKEVIAVCYGNEEFLSPPANDLNGRVAGVMVRYAQPVDVLDGGVTVLGGTYLERLLRSPLGVYVLKEAPEYYGESLYAFGQRSRLGTGPFRMARSSRSMTTQNIKGLSAPLEVIARLYGYFEWSGNGNVFFVSDFYFGPTLSELLPFHWKEKDLREFAVKVLTGWASIAQ